MRAPPVSPKDATMKKLLAQALAAALIMPTAAQAAQPYACGGAALAGGAQLISAMSIRQPRRSRAPFSGR